MNNLKILMLTVIGVLGVMFCSVAEEKGAEEKAVIPPAAPSGQMFSTNMAGGQIKGAPFSAEISADFIKKVMETSARIEECRKQIAERQAYLYESNPQIKAYRKEMIEMQTRINAILEADRELADLRLNRDILLTTMPVLPRGPVNFLSPRGGPISK